MFYRLQPFLFFFVLAPYGFAKPLVDVVRELKPSIVGVGFKVPLATVENQLVGTGFVVGNGKYIVTNEHVINAEHPHEEKFHRVIFVRDGNVYTTIPIRDVFVHDKYDIAIARIDAELPAVDLYTSMESVDDGTTIAITGYPIGAVLGLYPATHKGIVAARTPNIKPAQHSSEMSSTFLARLNDPLMVYQLDIVAYPGNSGSPVYVADSGEVFGVVNKVFVKETKEAVLSNPSGITYAIPIVEVLNLARQHGIELQ
ncbi:S1 family peptidase [Alteromonas sp. S167]|uniref:S1 family peptidase n=1 Tax=Alteromonas sp. S167 TaxID=3117402 RepID=UPI002FDF4305